MYLDSALLVLCHTQGAQAWITVLPAKFTMPAFTSYVFTRWCLHRLMWQTANYSSPLTNLPQKDERLSQPGWLAYSGQFTHVIGHPSFMIKEIYQIHTIPVQTGVTLVLIIYQSSGVTLSKFSCGVF